jgi:hypothetical protein
VSGVLLLNGNGLLGGRCVEARDGAVGLRHDCGVGVDVICDVWSLLKRQEQVQELSERMKVKVQFACLLSLEKNEEEEKHLNRGGNVEAL